MASRWAIASLCLVAFSAIAASAQPFPKLSTAVKIITNVTTLTTSGQFCTVSWSGVPNPTIADAIAYYVLAPNTTVDTLSPLKFQWVNKSPTYQQGSGSLQFQLLNQRFPIVFYYFYNISDTDGTKPSYTSAGVIGASTPIAVNGNTPTQGHLSFTNVTGQVLVQWTTLDVGSPVVQVGTAPGVYSKTFNALSATYTAADLFGQPATTFGYFFPGQLHYGLVTGLAPQTTYYYIYGDATAGFGFSKEYSFTTPPAPGANTNIHFIAWADAGQAPADMNIEYDYYDDYDIVMSAPFGTQKQVYASAFETWEINQGAQGASLLLVERLQQELLTWKPTLAINNGDISYARGIVTQWDVYFEQYQSIYTAVPVMALPGNHERDWFGTGDRFYPLQSRTDSGGEGGIPYELRLRMPQPSQREEWYSFDHGPIHFVQTSTEQPFGAGSPQWQFVVNDLQKVDRSVTPWVIVGFHRPIYTTSLEGVTLASDQGVAQDLRNSWETILFQYQVDMTWSGHVHVYERTCPVLYKTCLGYDANGYPLAPVHLDIGNGGYDLTWFINPNTPDYFDQVHLEHGYIHGEVNATTLHITAFSSETGAVIDDFVLKKPAGFKPNLAARNSFLSSGFTSNYTATFVESPGLGPDILFGAPFFNQLAADLKANATLLAALKAEVAPLVQDNNPSDDVFNLHQVFDEYLAVLQQPGFANSTPNAAETNLFVNQVIIPLFQLFDKNSAAQVASNGAFDAGNIKPGLAPTSPSPASPSPPPATLHPLPIALPPKDASDILGLLDPAHLKDILSTPLDAEEGRAASPKVAHGP